MDKSKEVVTLRMTRSPLRIGFKKNMVTLATSFNNATLISNAVYDTVTTSKTKDEPEKAEEMVRGVIDSVKLDVDCYHKMMEILKEKSDYNSLVEILNKEYKKQGELVALYHDCKEMMKMMM